MTTLPSLSTSVHWWKFWNGRKFAVSASTGPPILLVLMTPVFGYVTSGSTPKSCSISVRALVISSLRAASSVSASASWSALLASSLQYPVVLPPLLPFSSVGTWSQAQFVVRYVGSGGAVLMYIDRS